MKHKLCQRSSVGDRKMLVLMTGCRVMPAESHVDGPAGTV